MTQENPGADVIEKDIVQTQNEMSDTVSELQDKLQPKQLFKQVVGNPQDVPAQLFDAVKRNPVAAGLIGVGALWLVSGKQFKMPSMPSMPRKRPTAEGHDAHLSSIVRYEGESDEIYQGRLDDARATYLGTQRNGNEPSSSFRGRLDALTQGLRDKAKTMSGGAGSQLSGLKSSVTDRGSAARQWGSNKHAEAPFATAIAAAAAGAIAALAVPKTQIEREKLAPLRDTAMGKVTALKDQALEAASAKLS